MGNGHLVAVSQVYEDMLEAGLYVSGLGGFRHSDTAVIAESGMELLTYYPRDLESLTIPI
jgi:hypothetical protein